jgi:DNA-directed RNA polymerase specialized sigma24 family protein
MSGLGRDDPLEAIARVAIASRQRLLRVHHYRLRRADLEDCFSQATLELLTAARRGHRFANADAIRAALDQRLQSRIIDRQRALGGRSPITAALHHATTLDATADRLGATDGDLLASVIAREQLAHLAAAIRQLTPDQQLVLRSQLQGHERPAEFCANHGWSVEKYRKTAQRARAKLRRLAS